jgi:hypothetical protein
MLSENVNWVLLSLSDLNYDFNMVKEKRQLPKFLFYIEVIYYNFGVMIRPQ